MNPQRVPVARELFAQWQRARGGRLEAATRPFSRGWEDLLEDAQLVSAIDRAEAERDARALAAEVWIELKSARYKTHVLDRIAIPLAAETRWCEAFGFVAPSDDEARQMREFAWEPQLAFIRTAGVSLAFAELRRLNDFIRPHENETTLVPIKERSLQIFGDEKRLDALLDSTLFRTDRLDLARDLRCEVIGAPLAWKRGPLAAARQPVIVLENAATWHSYVRWNSERSLFSAVVYGGGNSLVDGIRYLADLFEELGGVRPILYFGDLDYPGLRIPQRANKQAPAGLPVIEPHLWSYRQLLELGANRGQLWDGEVPADTRCDWLGELAGRARELFAAKQRLAQELVGWEFLRTQVSDRDLTR